MFVVEMRGVSGAVGGVSNHPGVEQEGMRVVEVLPDSQVGTNHAPCSVLMKALTLVFLHCTQTPLSSSPVRSSLDIKQLFGLV